MVRHHAWLVTGVVFLAQGCPVDERSLAPGPGTGGASPATGGTAGGSAGDDGAGDAGGAAASDSSGGEANGAGGGREGPGGGAGQGGSSGSGDSGSGGSGLVGSGGTLGPLPCQGEGCSCESLADDACAGDDCCASHPVPAGSFVLGDEDPPVPASVAGFRLDRHEVSVGRFRAYVNGYALPPGPDSGQHDYVVGSGWRPEWDAAMPADANEFRERLACDGATWSDAAGAREARPINCVSWYEAFAFCAWDGGRLPTETEWEYAASGGDERRPYPWGDTQPDDEHARFGCDDCRADDLDEVGSRPEGAGRFGQLALAGNVAEWSLDYFAPYPKSCTHCANVAYGTERVARGGGMASGEAELRASHRASYPPESRDFTRGFRCARAE